MKTVGFIGVGLMGSSMVRNLMKHGFSVRIYARHPEKVSEVTAEGAVLCPSIAECVRGCDAVITMVGFPDDVRDVYYGEGRILNSAAAGTYLIDMTTISPALSQDLSSAGAAKSLHVLDAPVTGGDAGARAGTLSILVGGERADFEACLPLFQAMGTTINYQGGAGCGQHAKMANQIMIAGTLSGICEALAYARAKGLDLHVLLQSVATGAAGSRQLDLLGGKILNGDFAPGFYIKHFIKDMKLAAEEAGESDLTRPVLRQVLSEYCQLSERGEDQLGTQALIHYYEAADKN